MDESVRKVGKYEAVMTERKFLRFNYSKILLVAMFLFLTGFSAISAPYQCDVGGDGRLGLEEAIHALQTVSGMLVQGSLTVLDCGEPTGDITNPGTLSSEAKGYLLCKLNEIRSQVALGVSVANDETTHPVASNMQRLRWDNNLAAVASAWAAGCNYSHNSGRSAEYNALLSDPSPNVYVGENIYASSVDPSVLTFIWSGKDYGIVGAVNSWSAESIYWTYGTTYNNAVCQPDKVCGHFTQNVWAETTKVGCGYYSCPGGLQNAPAMKTMVVCNFAPGGNYTNLSVYLSGSSVDDVCSEGLQLGDTCENGLITPQDYNTGLDYECDVNGDGFLGLEEAVKALQVISGY